MQHKTFVFSMLFVAVLATSCNVERSEKYQTLLAERDSLYTEAVAAKGGFDKLPEDALEAIEKVVKEAETLK